MGPKRKDKRACKGKEREDRAEESKNKFDPIRLEVKYPGTAILLLQCEEKPVLLAAAAALAKFGSKSYGNLEILFDLEIVNSVIPLLEHEDLFTRRFAAKLLAEMVAIPNVRNYCLDSNYYIPYFTKVLANDKDIFMQEFSSLILAEMSKDMFGAAQILEQCPDMNFLFDRLTSSDPDVKKNNIEIMYNLLQDPIGGKEIIETKNFNFNLIYDLFQSPFPEIQKLALNVVTDLVSRNQDDRLHQLFRESNGLQALLEFLDNKEWQDLHTEALRILRLACDNPETVELLDDIGGIKQFLKYLEDKSNPKLFTMALEIAVRLSNTPRGRKALYAYGMIDYLLRTLLDNVQSAAYEISCHGIGMMTLYNRAVKDLTESDCIKSVLDILKDDHLKWSARQAALFALNRLLRCDIKNSNRFLDIQGQDYLLWLLRQPAGKIPVEILVGVVESLATIARNQALRAAVINAEMIDAICASFELTCPLMNDFKIASCNALSVICIEKIGREAFLEAQGPKRLYYLLCDVKSIPIRNAAVQLVQLLCVDPALADAFVAARYLNYMVNNRSTARAVPTWDTCIEALFNSHLPIKFAFTGRLSLHDVTKNGFYVLRRNICPFPILDDIFRFKFCPLEPVYVVNCKSEREGSREEMFHETGLKDDLKQTGTQDPSSRGIFLSTQLSTMITDSKFGRLQCDPCLYEYVELIKCKLIAAESKESVAEMKSGLVDISYVASRAVMLAKFVAQQMSGPDPFIRCAEHQLEIHLREIKDSIETSVIPLGMLRMGSYFERALLFKVIADRICLPAALVRGEYGKAWIEIAVPQVQGAVEETSFQPYMKRDRTCPEFITIRESIQFYPQDETLTEVSTDHRHKIFPTKLLKPNFVVDLMNSPGDLIPIGSRRAELYCEKQLRCETMCYY